MKDNLPEINIKAKRESKGGFLGWLRGLGSGPHSAMGAAGSASSAGSAGLGALLAGNIGTVIVSVFIAGALAAGYIANNASSPATTAGSLSSSKAPGADYVPAILRSQAANQGSSLAMFTDTNKGSGLSLQEAAAGANKKAADENAKDKAAAGGSDGGVPGGPGADVQSVLDGGAMPALQGGGGASSLSTSLGGKFSGGMGGKFGQGAIGPKVGMTEKQGAGFTAMPKFQERKGKLLAMKGTARPVTSGGKAATSAKFGSGSRNQLNAMRAKQRSYVAGSGVDAMRSTQDTAWTGTTATGDAGAGLDEKSGTPEIITSQSLDKTRKSGDGGDDEEMTIEEPCPGGDPVVCAKVNIEDVSPWKGAIEQCYWLIGLSLALSAIGGALVLTGFLAAIGEAICVIAGLLAAAALYIAIATIGIEYKQGWLALILGIGAGIAVAAAVTACMGNVLSALGGALAWVGAAVGICALIAALLG